MKSERLRRGIERIELTPAMDYRGGVDLGNAEENAVAQFLPAFHADPTQKRPGHFAEKRFHEIEP